MLHWTPFKRRQRMKKWSYKLQWSQPMAKVLYEGSRQRHTSHHIHTAENGAHLLNLLSEHIHGLVQRDHTKYIRETKQSERCIVHYSTFNTNVVQSFHCIFLFTTYKTNCNWTTACSMFILLQHIRFNLFPFFLCLFLWFALTSQWNLDGFAVRVHFEFPHFVSINFVLSIGLRIEIECWTPL